MGDFKVYYGAANAIAAGRQVYGVLFSPGSGYYKYSPLMALAFYPLSILPYYIACLVNYVLISVAIVFTSIFVLHIFNTCVFNNTVKSPNFILSIAFLCIAVHLIRELGLGNVNMILLLLLCLSLYGILHNRFIWAGMLLAIVLITKPFLGVILIPLLLRRYFKTILTTVILLVLFAILPSLWVGINIDIRLHNEWLNTMLIHANGFPSPNTIDALIQNALHWNASDALQYVILSIVLAVYVIYISSDIKQEGKARSNQTPDLIMEWFMLIAMVPCLFRTDTEHFLMTLPLIIFTLIYLFQCKNITLTVIFTVLILLYAGNSSDVLGRGLSYKMYDMGVLGISNLLIVAFSWYIYWYKVRTAYKTAALTE